MTAKYIIVKRDRLLSPFVFSEIETHNDIRLALGVSIENVHSAGFVVIASNGVLFAYGKSDGLVEPNSAILDMLQEHHIKEPRDFVQEANVLWGM